MKRQINILFQEENSGFPRFEIPENVTYMSLLFHCHVIGDSPIVNHFWYTSFFYSSIYVIINSTEKY